MQKLMKTKLSMATVVAIASLTPPPLVNAAATDLSGWKKWYDVKFDSYAYDKIFSSNNKSYITITEKTTNPIWTTKDYRLWEAEGEAEKNQVNLKMFDDASKNFSLKVNVSSGEVIGTNLAIAATNGRGSSCYLDFIAEDSTTIIASLHPKSFTPEKNPNDIYRFFPTQGFYAVYAQEEKYSQGASHYNFLSPKTQVLALADDKNVPIAGNISAIRVDRNGEINFWTASDLKDREVTYSTEQLVTIAAYSGNADSAQNVSGIHNKGGNINFGMNEAYVENNLQDNKGGIVIEVFNSGSSANYSLLDDDDKEVSIDLSAYTIGIHNSGGRVNNNSRLSVVTGNSLFKNLEDGDSVELNRVSQGGDPTIGIFNGSMQFAGEDDKRVGEFKSNGELNVDIRALNQSFGIYSVDYSKAEINGKLNFHVQSHNDNAYGIFANTNSNIDISGPVVGKVEWGGVRLRS